MFSDLKEAELYELYAGAGVYDLFYYIGKGAAKVCEVVYYSYKIVGGAPSAS